MNTIKIVLTGGPCAGKTKTLDAIVEHLTKTQKDNYKLLIVPESATELIQNGIIPTEAKKMYDFQDLIFLYQRVKEQIMDKATSISDINENYIIIYDRGIIDNKAYLENQKEFDTLLNKYDCSEINLLDQYDLVIDLISTANCNEELYESASNPARYEDLDLAKIRDIKTTMAWLGHRNLKVFNSNRNLDDKINDVINLIDSVINSEQTNEIKKYYIEGKLKNFKNYDENNSKLIHVDEVHLNIFDQTGCNYIIEKRTYKDNTSYVFTIKNEFDSKEKIIYSEVIDEKKCLQLMINNGINRTLTKDELHFVKDRQIYKINFYDDSTILEYEENRFNDKLVLPEEIKIIGEVKEINNSFVKTKKIC